MPRQSQTIKETEALRAVMDSEQLQLTPEEVNCAVQGLSPHINSAALRMAEKRDENRSVKLQAWGLAGASVLFAAVVWIVYQNWEFLLAVPMRWGLLLGFGIATFLIIGCLPIILRKEEEVS